MATAELNEFEAKKKNLIKKKKQIRAKKRFIVLLFLLICTGTIFVVLKAPFFNVKTIVCVGQTSLAEEEVVKIAGAKTDVNIFSTGVGTMKRRLAAHPSIAECNVRRLFPNKIKIWVRESKAVVSVARGEQLLLADKNGRIIKIVDKVAEAEPVSVASLAEFEPAALNVGEYIFDKTNANHSVISDSISVLDKLEMIAGVTMIDGSDLSDIQMEYQGRLRIMLGSYDDMEYKLTFIKKVIDENISKYEKAELDFRGSSLYVGPISEEVVPEADAGQSAEGEIAEQNTETKTTENAEG